MLKSVNFGAFWQLTTTLQFP